MAGGAESEGVFRPGTVLDNRELYIMEPTAMLSLNNGMTRPHVHMRNVF
jgi:hypothetical protein